MGQVKLNKKLFILLYYAFLLAVFFTWQDLDNNPSATYRLIYFGLVVLPMFYADIVIVIPVFTLFYILARDNYTPSYLPTEIYTYCMVLLVVISLRWREQSKQNIPRTLFLLLVLVSLRNLFNTSPIEYVSFAFLFLVISIKLGVVDNVMSTKYLSYAFIAAGIVISIYHVLYGQMMAVTGWMEGQAIERQGFKDINYTACLISLGVCSSILNLFANKRMSIIGRIILIGSLILMLYSLIVNASRASLLAVFMTLLIISLFFSNKQWMKICIVLLFFIGIYAAYNYGLLDYLIYRIENDNGTGTNRTVIWRLAINRYTQSPSLFDLIFGFGYENGRKLVNPINTAIHNDFIAFFVEYGIVGGVSFLLFFFYPVFHIKVKENKMLAYSAMASLFVESMTLEPFAAGRWGFFAFWLFVWGLGRKGLSNDNVETTEPKLEIIKKKNSI